MWFELQDGSGAQVVSWGDGAPSADGDSSEVVFEDRVYGLIIHDADPLEEYELQVGDELVEVEAQRFRPTEYCFLLGMYFESACGRSILSLKTQSASSGSTSLGAHEFYVLPSKIGKDNYQRMMDDLQQICQSLVNDLIGKSHHSRVWSNHLRSQLFRSCEEEFRSVTQTWRSLHPLLAEIEKSPACAVIRRMELSSVVRNRSFHNLPLMLKHGINPVNPISGRKSPLARVALTVNTTEHRLIKWFLTFLIARLQKCKEGLLCEIHAIEKDKRFRSRAAEGDALNLYDAEDRPRLLKLMRYAKSIESQEREMHALVHADFWSQVGDLHSRPEKWSFSAENRYYRLIAKIILDYLRNGFNHAIKVGNDFTTKNTSRMYEQWLIVQTVLAFEVAGVHVDSWDEVVRTSLNRQFGFDFKRNTCFTARLSEDYVLSIRYEPWILPRTILLAHQEETLCHGGKMDTFWSPDCVIELQRMGGDRLRTIYAIVLDAKYSRNPSTKMRESVAKYQQIRCNDGKTRGSQVARQVWVVYSGREDQPEGISIDDEALTFSAMDGPIDSVSNESVGADELIHGDLVVRPRWECKEQNSSVLMHGVFVNKVMIDFAKGTLAYFNKVIDSPVRTL